MDASRRPAIAYSAGDDDHPLAARASRPDDIVPENIPLEIVYQDADLLVINKPAGLVVHPGAGNWTGTLVQCAAVSRARPLRHRRRTTPGHRAPTR